MLGSPLYSISGNSDADQIDMGGSQEYNQTGLVKPITKWTRLVAQTERLPEYVGTGFRKALGGRPGPRSSECSLRRFVRQNRRCGNRLS